MGNLYNITDDLEFISIDGVVGTPAYGMSYLVKKTNIKGISSNTAYGTVSIQLLTNVDYQFHYTTMIDPSTGEVFTTLHGLEQTLIAFADQISGAPPIKLISQKSTIGTTAEQILPTAMGGYITIYSPITNTGGIAIGLIDVTFNSVFSLVPGEKITIEHDDLSEIYLISDVAAQTVLLSGGTISVPNASIVPMLSEDGDVLITEIDEVIILG